MKTNLPVIPVPKEICWNGADEAAKVTVRAAVCTLHAPFRTAAAAFCEIAKKTLGAEIADANGGIELVFDAALSAGEYRIVCSERGACAYAADEDGASYALATILQLMEVVPKGLMLPDAVIHDKPDCGYRSLMVDLARQWHTFEEVLVYVDLCWLYKVKFLHLHFIDSQSYTLPSDVFPGLSTPDRHYTRAQIEQLRAYARSRSVEIIPEFEVPGHAAAMIGAYPELFANTPVDPAAAREHDNLLCIGKPGVMENIRKLLQEMADLFPESRYLHIGGDEAEIDQWNDCVDCRRYMEENGIDGVRALYTHCVKLVSDMVLDMGRTPIVWEGFPREGAETISRKVIVVAWESYYHLAPELLEEGFNIINCAWKPLYITPNRYWTAEDIMGWNIYNWQHWWPNSIARLNPIHVQPTDQVMGAQLCAWEGNYSQEIDRVKENLAALSERTWNLFRWDDDEEFRGKLNHVLKLADRLAPKTLAQEV